MFLASPENLKREIEARRERSCEKNGREMQKGRGRKAETT